MRTESSKSYQFGFVLTEAELRRIVGIMEEQLRKIPGATNVTNMFDLKYKNGSLGKTTSLEEVLSQENLGSSQIVELRIACTSEQRDLNSIAMEFRNVDSISKSEAPPIHLSVKGDERDWTFVSSSFLEERALRIKRRPFGIAIGLHREWELLVYLVALLIGFMSFLFLDSMFRPVPQYLSVFDDEVFSIETGLPLISEQLESKVRDGKINDPIQALILREKLNEERSQKSLAQWRERDKKRESRWREIGDLARRSWLPRWYIVPALILPPMLIYLFRTFLVLYYPTYVFAWGDYIEVFRRKESVRKFIVGVILVGLIVSFIGGVLANLVRLR